MTKAKRKLSPQESRRLDEHARKSTDAMRRATSARRPAPRGSVAPSGPADALPQPPKSRRGKKAVVIYLSEDQKEQYARIAASKRMTTQQLGAFAISLMFAHFGSKSDA